jgi:hypothetical protein
VVVDGMKSVTDADGNLRLRPISERLAVKSCRPLMRDLAPEVPARSWHVTSGWTNDFPSHATRYIPFDHDPVEGEPNHFLSCFMPGTYEPSNVAGPGSVPEDPTGVRSACAELARIDFAGWEVTALDHADGVTSAALLSPNGFAAGCVLGTDPAMPIVWIPEHRPRANDVVLIQYASFSDATPVALSGFAGRRVTDLVLTAGSGETLEMTATDGWFAGAAEIDGPLFGGRGPVVKAFDAVGDRVWRKSALPAECLASLEEQHGC